VGVVAPAGADVGVSAGTVVAAPPVSVGTLTPPLTALGAARAAADGGSPNSSPEGNNASAMKSPFYG